MSRIGKKIIAVPAGVTVTLDSVKNAVHVKGKLGELSEVFLPFITITQEASEINLTIKDENDRLQKAMWGTARALLNNMIVGVSEGYTKQLELNGVGYRMEMQGTNLKLALGFSHPVVVPIPTGVKVVIDKNLMTMTSHDKQLLGHFAQKVHDLKPCEPYKHKGFKYPGKFYPKKVGKKMAK